MSRKQAASAQVAKVARQATRQCSAGRLDEPDPRILPRRHRGPKGRGELTVQVDHQDRHRRDRFHLALCLELRLNRGDRALERGVVQLHHVRPFRPRPLQSASQVDVNHVEPARAQGQVGRLDIDHDVIPDLSLADGGDIRPSLASLAGDLYLQRIHPDDHAAPQLQHQARAPTPCTIASHTSSISSSRVAATDSWGVWFASVPLASKRQG